jgi:hypothetical protein
MRWQMYGSRWICLFSRNRILPFLFYFCLKYCLHVASHVKKRKNFQVYRSYNHSACQLIWIFFASFCSTKLTESLSVFDILKQKIKSHRCSVISVFISISNSVFVLFFYLKNIFKNFWIYFCFKLKYFYDFGSFWCTILKIFFFKKYIILIYFKIKKLLKNIISTLSNTTNTRG